MTPPIALINSVKNFPKGIIYDEKNTYVDQYLGAHNNLPMNFKRTTLAKFGMKKLSLDPVSPNVEDFDMNYPSRNYEF